MAFADPQSLTIDGSAVSLPRTGFSTNSGRFTSADGEVGLEISHSLGSRYRHLVRITDARIVGDPLVPDQNRAVNMSAHLVIDMPRNGYTAAEVADLSAALTAWATEDNLLKVISGES